MTEARELLEHLRLEDLRDNSDYFQMAQLVGMEAFCKLVLNYGGSNPYIPKADSLIKPIRNILINREFDGGNDFRLAKKWGLSERYIRTLVKEKAEEIKKEQERPLKGQIKFF